MDKQRYKRVLAAFDGSESARGALTEAISLARTEKSWVKVVSVVPSFGGELDLTGVRDVAAAIKGPAERLLVQAREIAEAQGVGIITNVEEGEAYERIVDVADSENCDVIVMGRKGHGRIEKALMGCVTERVIGYTSRDVLVIPKGAKLSWGSVAVSTDGSSSSEAAARKAATFARAYGARLVAVSAVEVNDEFLALAPGLVEDMARAAHKAVKAAGDIAAEYGVPFDGLVREGDAASVITNAARDAGAGLIVMASRGRKGIGRLIMGSVTKKVVGLSRCPVLVIGANG